MGDPFLDALTNLHGPGFRGSEITGLSLRRGRVTAWDGTTGTATLVIGGTASEDVQAVYTNVPSITALTVGDTVFWLQTGAGLGLILGPPASA